MCATFCKVAVDLQEHLLCRGVLAVSTGSNRRSGKSDSPCRRVTEKQQEDTVFATARTWKGAVCRALSSENHHDASRASRCVIDASSTAKKLRGNRKQVIAREEMSSRSTTRNTFLFWADPSASSAQPSERR